jgi:hypothetical protein
MTKIEISIYIDGQGYYCMRMWPAVPRVGEEIMIRRVEQKEGADEHAIAIVDSVCWGTSSDSREQPWSELRVSLFCHWR